MALHLREVLLTVHLLAVIVWIGFGFFELWLGRAFLRLSGTPAGAPLIRLVYRSDVVVFIATLAAFAAGIAMALTLGWGFFQHLWLGIKQAIMIAVLVVVAVILPTALKLGGRVADLPEGPGPATPEIVGLYRRLEPWYLIMRLAAVAAVVLAVWKPG